MYNTHDPAVIRQHIRTRAITGSELRAAKIQAIAQTTPATPLIAGYPDIAVDTGTIKQIAASTHAHIGMYFPAKAAAGSMAGSSFEI